MKVKLWQESFVPVLFILLILFTVLLLVEFKINEETERSIVIHIPTEVETISAESTSTDEDIDTVSANSPEREKIFTWIKAKQWKDVESFVRAQLNNQETSEMLTYLALVYGKQGKYDMAKQALGKAEASQPLFSSLYFYQGLILARQGELKKATASYEKQIKLIPYHFEAHYNLGLTQQKLGEYEKAKQTFEKTLGLASGKRKAKAYYSLGTLLKRQGDSSAAKQAFVAAIRLQPDYTYARFGLASLYFGKPDGLKKAMQEYDTVLSLKPGYAPVYFQEGLAYSSFSKYKKAAKAYKKAIQLNPNYKKARYNLGLQLIRLKKWSEAKEQFQWILERESNHAKSYFNLARVAAGQGNIEQALTYYTKAIELRDGNYPAAYVNRGLLYVDQADYQQAFTALEHAIALQPKYASAWYSLGVAYLQAGDNQQAEQALKKAVAYKPSTVKAWDILGNFFAASNRSDEAVDAFLQVLKYEPKNKEALFALAEIYTEQKQYEKAKNLYKDILDIYPSYALAWQKLGVVQGAMNDIKHAEDSLRQAVFLDSKSMSSRRELAALLFRAGKHKQASEIYASLVDDYPANAMLRLEYARVLQAVGNITESEMELQKGLRLEPSNQAIQKALDSLSAKE